MNIKEVAEYLKNNNYVFEWEGELIINSKFKRDLRRAELSKGLMVVNPGVPVTGGLESTKDRFKRFIREAGVPYRISTENGDYTANAYSLPSERVFNKALKDGINYQALVASTKLYYKGTGYKQKISNYFVMGTWESEYDEFIKRLSEGTIVKHIDGQTKGKFGKDL